MKIRNESLVPGMGWCKCYYRSGKSFLTELWVLKWDHREEGKAKWWGVLFQLDSRVWPLTLSAEHFLTFTHVLLLPSLLPDFFILHLSLSSLFILFIYLFTYLHTYLALQSFHFLGRIRDSGNRWMEYKQLEMEMVAMTLWSTVSQWIWQTI